MCNFSGHINKQRGGMTMTRKNRRDFYSFHLVTSSPVLGILWPVFLSNFMSNHNRVQLEAERDQSF